MATELESSGQQPSSLCYSADLLQRKVSASVATIGSRDGSLMATSGDGELWSCYCAERGVDSSTSRYSGRFQMVCYWALTMGWAVSIGPNKGRHPRSIQSGHEVWWRCATRGKHGRACPSLSDEETWPWVLAWQVSWDNYLCCVCMVYQVNQNISFVLCMCGLPTLPNISLASVLECFLIGCIPTKTVPSTCGASRADKTQRQFDIFITPLRVLWLCS